jgi:two-component system NtrC family sensor kinase
MPSTSQVKVLVVDDEPEIAESLADLLVKKAGYQVTIARDGRDAMSILEKATTDPDEAFDLVLLDVRMPMMSGPEVLSWLRKHPALQYTRVVMLTAASGTEEKIEALAAGADDYITKPYYPHELLARVKTILRTQQLEKELQRQSQQLVALNRVSQVMTAKLTTGDVVTRAALGIDMIFDVEIAAVYLIDDNRSILQCRKMHGRDYVASPGKWLPIPIGEGIIGQAYESKESICINEVKSDDRFRPGSDAPYGFEARSIMATPLQVRDKQIGVLSALNKREGSFSEVDLGLFTSLASSVSRAVEITWLFQGIRQRQQDLLESRNTLQAVIDGILHPIYTIDDSWRLVSVNQTKFQELQMPAEDLVGRACYRVLFGRDEKCDHCPVNVTLEKRQAQNWSVKFSEEDMMSQEWDVNAYPIPGSLAGSARAVVVWQDRTEERRLENSLMQAGKLAAIGQLAAGVAHEINNPLTAINANAQMLEMTISPEDEVYESVDLILRAGERAAKVVRGLLDFARQSQYSFENLDINQSIQQSLQLVSYQFAAADIKVLTSLAPDLPSASASLEHLQSVWLNLLINARDALLNVRGERRVEVISKFAVSSDEILVAVRDTGYGMSPAELDHIFEPFFTTKDPGQGTGLGLATCHRIIEQHGGSIDVLSSPGKGTTFVVRLPLPRQAELV